MLIKICAICGRYIERLYCPYCKQGSKVLLTEFLEGEEIGPDLHLMPDVKKEGNQ